MLLHSSIQASFDLAIQMQKDLTSACALELMELKAEYLDAMIKLLPDEVLCEEVARKRRLVEKMLLDYW